MISKNKIAYLTSLQNKKTRYEFGRFLVEGKKSILEAVASNFRIIEGFLSHDFLPKLGQNFPIELIDEKTLKKISSLSANRDGVVVVEMPKNFLSNDLRGNWNVVIDNINDPGNLGTILRIADWYGIKNIIASENTVDIYNPKAIMASMGSFSRVNIFYENLEIFFEKNSGIPVYGAYLDGKNIREIRNPIPGFLLIGSEAHGISENLEKWVTQKITIGRFGGAESLNA